MLNNRQLVIVYIRFLYIYILCVTYFKDNKRALDFYFQVIWDITHSRVGADLLLLI